MFTIRLSRRFVKELKSLKKKFHKISDDLDSLFSLLRQGKLSGDQVQGFRTFTVYKVRLRNSSRDVGKSGGFRIVYYLKINEASGGDIVALTIYSKSNKTNISKKEIVDILENENLI